jgi:Arc/MetJ-type ribon-helix-helix transcriptional regulator
MKKLKSYRLSENTIALIEKLRENLHMSSNSDVIRAALVLLDKHSSTRGNTALAYLNEGAVDK